MSKKTDESTIYLVSDVDELFNFVKQGEKWIICVGKYKVSAKEFNTTKECEQYLEKKPFEILINVSTLIGKLAYETEKQDAEENTANAQNH